MAAAIGAATQHQVPVIGRQPAGRGPSDPASTSVRPFAIEELRAEDGTLPATIVADADGAHRIQLEPSIPGTA